MRFLISLLTSLLVLSTPVLALARDGSDSNPLPKIRETVENRIEQAKEKVASREAFRQERREQKQASLSAMRDQKKAQIALKFVENLNKINKNRTDMMSKFLDNAQKILDRLFTKVTEAKTAGKDTTKAEAAIADAKTALTAARTAVSTQAAKDYSLPATTTDTSVKTLATTQKNTLKTGLESTMKSVQLAKKAVSTAIRTAATTLFGEKKDASGSAVPVTKP